MSLTTFHFFIKGKDALPTHSIRAFLQAIEQREVCIQAAEPTSLLCGYYLSDPLKNLRSLGKHLRHHGGAYLDIAT